MRIVQYIEDRIAGWNLNPIWVHPAIFQSASSRTFNIINSQESSYANEFAEDMRQNNQFLMVLCTSFVREAMDLNYVEEIVNANIPVDSDECGIAFEAAYNKMLSRITKRLGAQKAAHCHNSVSLLYEAYLICCHQFLVIADFNNYKDKVLEEVELAQEIELFKRKEWGNDERPDNSSNRGGT